MQETLHTTTLHVVSLTVNDPSWAPFIAMTAYTIVPFRSPPSMTHTFRIPLCMSMIAYRAETFAHTKLWRLEASHPSGAKHVREEISVDRCQRLSPPSAQCPQHIYGNAADYTQRWIV